MTEDSLDFTDPRLQANEPFFQSIHRQVFDISMQLHCLAQESVDEAAQQEALADVHRAFAMIKSAPQIHDQELLEQLSATSRASADEQLNPVFVAHIQGACVCTLLLQRIWESIPDDLQQVPVVRDDLLAKRDMHWGMWQQMLADVAGLDSH